MACIMIKAIKIFNHDPLDRIKPTGGAGWFYSMKTTNLFSIREKASIKVLQRGGAAAAAGLKPEP